MEPAPAGALLAAGHRHGLAQPALTVVLRMTATGDPRHALPRIDQWLREALGIDMAAVGEPRLAPGVRAPTGAVLLAWRLLLLAGELLRLVRLPSFEPGCVLGLEPERGRPGSWRLAAAVPMVEEMPRLVHDAAYSKASAFVDWMQRTPCTPPNAAVLHARVEDEFLRALKDRVPGGLSTIPILEAAYRRGIPFRHLGGGAYQLGWGRNSRRVERGAVDLDSAIGAKLSHDKRLTAQVLRAAGLPAPVHLQVRSADVALDAARRLGWPVVIKPVDRDRGEGVTVNVADEPALRAACAAAFALSPRALVERQVPGVCHRLHVAGGRLLIVSRRLPKSVKGDGRRTVAELIRAANEEEECKPPWSRLKPYPDDALALDSLRAAGLALDSVPQEGCWAPLRPIQSVAWGGVVEDYTGTIHPDNVELALRAAEALGLSAAGVDVISEDIRVPWHESGAIVNEVNYAPQTTPSAAGRHMLESFLDRYCPENGRIPVEAVMGGASALALARARRQELSDQGVACYLAAAEGCLDPVGAPVPLAAGSLFDRVRALLMRPDAGALVVAVQTGDWLRSGLPVDRFDRATVLDEALLPSAAGGESDEPARRRLAGMLRAAAAAGG
ncbi:MAG: hypothetical protein ACLGII_08355 [Gammaproteobacteria bacterium]